MIPCAILLPMGFFLYGWSAQFGAHWILPNLGAALISACIIVLFVSIQLYIMDCYPKYTASALAPTIMLRALAGFSFPLFAPAMYTALGYGWGNSILGFLGIFLGIPAPILLWKFGSAIRSKSQYTD